MEQALIRSIEQSMLKCLDNAQLDMLDKTLNRCFEEVSITKKDENSPGLTYEHTNEQFVDLFISAKTIEGCSIKTMNLYRQELDKCVIQSELNATQMTTNYLRDYLSKYYENGKCSKSTIDSKRRMISSFFAWMEDEEYIRLRAVNDVETINATELQRIFNRTFRLDQSRTGTQLGLGLHIVQQLIHKQGGKVAADVHENEFIIEVSFRKWN